MFTPNDIETDRDSTIDLLLASIAFTELGLAHIIRAEAEKIKFVLGSHGNETSSLEKLLKTNKSVERVMRKVIDKEMLLAFQLEDVIELALQEEDPDPIMPESVELDYEYASIYLDELHQLTATVFPNNSTHKDVTWVSDSPIAKVSSSGLVTPVEPGIAKITATTVNGHTASCLVTVKPIAPSSITLNYTTTTLYTGQTRQLTATMLPADARDKSVTWTSNRPQYATVSANGLITAVYQGTVTITATTVNGLTAECVVTVRRNEDD